MNERPMNERSGSARAPRPMRVLIVEDEALVALNLEDILRDLGHVVAGTVMRLDRALHMAESGLDADIAILDVNVGGLPVYPLAEKLEAAGMPLVFATGYGRSGLEARWQRYPVVQKPYSAHDIYKALLDPQATAAGEGRPAAAQQASADWSAAQYLKFEDERTRPARDLLARIGAETPRRIVDIGCGPGNSTELIHARWPKAEVIGMDSSPTMVEAARKRLPHIRFETADITGWKPPAGADVLFANAVFQWLPDHPAVIRRLFGDLEPGGWIAVQMPDNLLEPSHVLMTEVARDLPFGGKLAGVAREKLPAPGFYHDLLVPLADHVDLWTTIYQHPMKDAAAIVEWVRGTALRPFLDRLEADEQARYLAAYEAALARAYPPLADGTVLLAFPRLFIVARRR